MSRYGCKLEGNLIDEIVEKYKTDNYSLTELGKQYNIHRMTVANYLKKRNVEIKHVFIKNTKVYYKIDQNYFDKIDTEDKAYFLGLLYADGSYDKNHNCVVLGLKTEDREILEIFNKQLNSNKPLSVIKPSKSPTSDKLNTGGYKLYIVGSNICSRLLELGIIQNKSLKLKFPTEKQVPKILLKSFIRGYVDGDGSFSYWKSKRKGWNQASFNVVSTFDFCKDLQDYILLELGIKSTLSNRGGKLSSEIGRKITRTLIFSGIPKVFKMINWLYKDSTFRLNRKYNKYVLIKMKLSKIERYRKLCA